MNKFKSIWVDTPSFVANSSGETCRQLYKKDIDEFGEPYLKEDGTEDTRKIIQSYADSTSVVRIVQRHLAGDPTALNSNPGINDINKKGDVDLQFANGKTLKELESAQNLQIYNLYNNFSGKANISIDEFKKLVLAGDYAKLEEYKEVNSNE